MYNCVKFHHCGNFSMQFWWMHNRCNFDMLILIPVLDKFSIYWKWKLIGRVFSTQFCFTVLFQTNFILPWNILGDNGMLKSICFSRYLIWWDLLTVTFSITAVSHNQFSANVLWKFCLNCSSRRPFSLSCKLVKTPVMVFFFLF